MMIIIEICNNFSMIIIITIIIIIIIGNIILFTTSCIFMMILNYLWSTFPAGKIQISTSIFFIAKTYAVPIVRLCLLCHYAIQTNLLYY